MCSADQTVSPFNYYLCRSDKQTKTRHIEKYHAKTDAEKSKVRFVDTNAMEAKEALKSYKIASNKKTPEQGQSCEVSERQSPLPPEDEISTDLLMPTHKQQLTETSQALDDIDSLESKVDTVIHMLKNVSINIEQQKSSNCPDVSTIVKELSTDEDSQVDWSAIENIIDLTEKVRSIRFFAGQFGQKGCVRCEICFNYLFSRDGILTKRDPLLVDDDDGQAIATHIKKYVIYVVFLNRV